MSKLFFLTAAETTTPDGGRHHAKEAGQLARTFHPDHIRLIITEYLPACHNNTQDFFHGHGTPSVGGISHNNIPTVVDAGIMQTLGVERALEGRENVDAKAIARDLTWMLGQENGAALITAAAAVLQPAICHCNDRRNAVRGNHGHAPIALSPVSAGDLTIVFFSDGLKVENIKHLPANTARLVTPVVPTPASA